MKILLTGGSGFLGSIIQHVMADTGKDIISLGRSGGQVKCDLSTTIPKLPVVGMVIHAAGKAHSVPKTEIEKKRFFDTNVTGTTNLLKGLDQDGIIPAFFIFISSVSVYGQENGTAINEMAPLAATDAYGRSKVDAEQIIQAWCAKHNVICTILRLPLVAGPNPPGNLDAMINGLKKGYYVNILGGKARKSMVLAEDVARIILKASKVGGIYNLTDGYHPSFYELSLVIAKQLGLKEPYNIPDWLARILAKAGDLLGPRAPINSSKLRKITSSLTFDDSKARRELNWQPGQVLNEFKIQ